MTKLTLDVDEDSTREVVENIQKYQKDKLKDVSRLISRTATAMHLQALRDIQVRTGYAKSTTYLNPTKDSQGNWIGAEIGTTAPYAKFIEFRVAYLSRAYNTHIRQFLSKLRSIMKSK